MTELAAAVIPNSDVSMLAKDVAAVIFHIFTPFTTRKIPVALSTLSLFGKQPVSVYFIHRDNQFSELNSSQDVLHICPFENFYSHFSQFAGILTRPDVINSEYFF